MPFVVIHGIPKDTPKVTLWTLRRNIVAVVARAMSAPVTWIRPFFVPDLLDESVEVGDGCKTIYIRVDTAMFSKERLKNTPKYSITGLLARVVWEAFEGQYEVECFVGDLDPGSQALIEAVKPAP